MDDVKSNLNRPSAAGHRLPLLLAALVLALLIAAASLPSFAQSSSVSQPAASPDEEIQLLSADDNGVTIHIRVPSLQRAPYPEDDGYEQLSIAGYANLERAGYPSLPQRNIFIALPPGAEPRLTLRQSSPYTVTDVFVLPAARSQLLAYDYGDPRAIPTFTRARTPDRAVYAADALFPASPVSLGQETWLRQQRVVVLQVRPVQANAARRSLVVHTEMDVRIDFVFPRGRAPRQLARPESPAFERVLRDTVLNYDQGRDWRQTQPLMTAAQTAAQTAASPCLGSNAFRIGVQETGIYGLSQVALQNAGIPPTLSAASLRMCHRDQEIPIKVLDANANQQFDSGDTILFYGVALRTQETDTNIYWLTYGGEDGLRIAENAGNPNGATRPVSYDSRTHFEEDHSYYSRIPTEDLNDHWYWGAPLNSAGVDTLTIDFSLDNLSTIEHTVPITVEVWGWIQDENHSYRVHLNGYPVGTTTTFYGSGVENVSSTFTASTDPGVLINGTNTLTIEAVLNGNGTNHSLLVNWAEIMVQRKFVAVNDRLRFGYQQAGTWEFKTSGFSAPPLILNVTDPNQPVEITTTDGGPGNVIFGQTLSGPAQYALSAPAGYLTPASIVKDTPSNLRGTGQQADYIIITDPLLNSALAPLVSLRQQEFTVKKVIVQDIFDEFSYGIFDPRAIHDFLEYTATSWQSPAPTYVLLAGDATYDYRNLLGLQSDGEAYVPAYLRSGIDSDLGEAAADNQYVDFNGDGLEDMFLGRLPARNAGEMTIMVNKIIAYESAPSDPTWQSAHLFLSDNGFLPPVANPTDPCEQDAAGDFFAHVENFVQAYLPNSQTLHRVYYAPPDCYPRAEYPVYASYFATSAEQATLRFLPLYNQGSEFVSYVGHSSILEWGKEKYLTTDMMPQLQNGGRTPIMLPMTCLVGFYQQPQGDSLAEAILKNSQGGSVASYAPTGLQVQHGHDYLLQGFYTAVFANHAERLGEAVYGAKQHLFANDSFAQFEDLQDTYMLLGDPALRLNSCRHCTRTFLPLSLSQP